MLGGLISQPFDNTRHVSVTHTELTSENGLCHIPCGISFSDCFYLFICELCMSYILSLWTSILGFFVSHILGLSRKKEMGRIATSRNIAPMANTKALGDVPKSKLPSHTMTSNISSRETEGPITIRLLCCCPYPTFAGLVNVSPETVNNGCIKFPDHGKAIAFMAAKFGTALIQTIWIYKKRFATLKASACNSLTGLQRHPPKEYSYSHYTGRMVECQCLG